jgi:hypothetical protein
MKQQLAVPFEVERESHIFGKPFPIVWFMLNEPHQQQDPTDRARKASHND